MTMFYKTTPKFLLICICISCSNNKVIEQQSIDSLKKYSYLVAGLKTLNNEQKAELLGTGFFFKADEGYALITAKHLIGGYNTFTKEKILSTYDTIGIRYFKEPHDSVKYLSIPIKSIKEKIANKLFYESPDVIWILIDTVPKDFKINSLEKIITDYKIYDETPEKIIIFGYGANESDTLKFNLNNLPVYSYEGHLADVFHVNPYCPFNDSLNLVIQPEIRKGFSGSPVFFKYSKMGNGIEKEWITFGGLSFGTNNTYKSAYIVRPYTVIRELIRPSIYINP